MRHLAVVAACMALAACGGSGEERELAAGNQAEAGDPATSRGDGKSAKTTLLGALTGSADHATLASAIKAAGLERTLSGAQPYTLFAPTEAAFGKLPAGTVDGLLAPDAKGRLTALLTGHIVPGTVTAEDIGKAVERGKGKAQLATVGGANLSFARQGDALVVTDSKGGQARVVTPDGAASNGVLHGVDAVLMAQ